MKKLFAIFLLLACGGCSDNRTADNGEIKEVAFQNISLIGEWDLDSVSTNDLRLVANDKHSFYSITFKNNNNYTIVAKDNDNIAWTDNGKYFILQNPKRRLYTIAFIPDLTLYGKDTIRPLCSYNDIVSIGDNKLEVMESTTYRDDLPDMHRNHFHIYKRVK